LLRQTHLLPKFSEKAKNGEQRDFCTLFSIFLTSFLIPSLSLAISLILKILLWNCTVVLMLYDFRVLWTKLTANTRLCILLPYSKTPCSKSYYLSFKNVACSILVHGLYVFFLTQLKNALLTLLIITFLLFAQSTC